MTIHAMTPPHAASNGDVANGDAIVLARDVAALMTRANQLFLSRISWSDYQAILNEREGERRLRHAYDRGRLEPMVRSWEHERPKMLWAYLVFILRKWVRQRRTEGTLVTP